MAIDSHFIHKCTIQRLVGTLDEYGNASDEHYVVDADVPCRLVEKTQRAVTEERAELVVVTSYVLLLGPDADVVERDQVTVFVLDGEEYDTRVFTVKAVLKRRARGLRHYSVALEAVG